MEDCESGRVHRCLVCAGAHPSRTCPQRLGREAQRTADAEARRRALVDAPRGKGAASEPPTHAPDFYSSATSEGDQVDWTEWHPERALAIREAGKSVRQLQAIEHLRRQLQARTAEPASAALDPRGAIHASWGGASTCTCSWRVHTARRQGW